MARRLAGENSLCLTAIGLRLAAMASMTRSENAGFHSVLGVATMFGIGTY